VGETPGVRYTDREAEKLARDLIPGLSILRNGEGDHVAVFWFVEELMATRPYRNRAHAYLAAVDFIRQAELC
jgi:hypothetical protein